MTNPDAKKFATEFGAALSKQLAKRGTNQRTLASGIGSSPSYVNHLLAGRKAVYASTVNSISDTLDLTAAERVELHRAAAKDAGFEIDLSNKKSGKR